MPMRSGSVKAFWASFMTSRFPEVKRTNIASRKSPPSRLVLRTESSAMLSAEKSETPCSSENTGKNSGIKSSPVCRGPLVSETPQPFRRLAFRFVPCPKPRRRFRMAAGLPVKEGFTAPAGRSPARLPPEWDSNCPACRRPALRPAAPYGQGFLRRCRSHAG